VTGLAHSWPQMRRTRSVSSAHPSHQIEVMDRNHMISTGTKGNGSKGNASRKAGYYRGTVYRLLSIRILGSNLQACGATNGQWGATGAYGPELTSCALGCAVPCKGKTPRRQQNRCCKIRIYLSSFVFLSSSLCLCSTAALVLPVVRFRSHVCPIFFAFCFL
jgi:hypothetical protein